MSDRQPESQITIVLLPDGVVRIRATCAGLPDSAYAPLPDHAVGVEVDKLLVELRQREGGLTS